MPPSIEARILVEASIDRSKTGTRDMRSTQRRTRMYTHLRLHVYAFTGMHVYEKTRGTRNVISTDSRRERIQYDARGC